jgi:dihydrofolate synthase/folylpolyglutamate synthase
MNIESEYQETIKWLYDLHLFGIKFGLEKVEKLLEYLGNPQDKLRVIHIGGTNGKGSVCSMISSILTKMGYSVGMNTSPHLSEFTERIQINGKQISKAKVIEYANRLVEIREKVNAETEFGYATYFEIVTAMALQYFADKEVDYVVLEVGLGGTLDATNVVTPLISVITNIGLDHTEHLGNTLTSVAQNKAGIIKPKIPVLTSNTNTEILDVISKKSNELNCTLYQLGDQIKYKIIGSSDEGISLDYDGLNLELKDLNVGLLGKHQAENAAMALGILDILSAFDAENWDIDEDKIRTGLLNAKWPGRLEIVQRSPIVLLDGAHNPEGAITLQNALKLFEYNNLNLIFGCSEEKDIKAILDNIMPNADRIYLTQANVRRATKPEIILEIINDSEVEKIIIPDVTKAVVTAIENSNPDDMICICGSLFIVGEAREYFVKNERTDKHISEDRKKFRIHY